MEFLLERLTRFSDLGILLVRLMVALVFFDSGWNDLANPVHRSASIGMSQHFTIFLGLAEIAGALAVAVGLLTQLAGLGLIIVMGGQSRRRFSSGTQDFGVGRATAGTMNFYLS
jgi:putative oxidoreductase